MGSVLLYQQKVMVSKARGDNTVFQGTHHKAFALSFKCHKLTVIFYRSGLPHMELL